MPMFDPTTAQIARYGADAFIRLAAMIATAEEIEYEASPNGPTRTGGTEYADPTFDAVADPRRAELHATIQRARATLLEAAEAARQANRDLYDAVERWEGKE